MLELDSILRARFVKGSKLVLERMPGDRTLC